MSPELIAPERFGFKNSRPTKHSDCYALGMLIYETISGNLPFYKDTNPAVFMKIVEGKHPPRGMRFTDNLWEMLELCWATQPLNRPTAEHVLRRLETVSSLPEPSSGTDEEIEEDGDGWDSTFNSSGVPNWLGGTAVTERKAANSPGLSYFGDHPSTGPVWAVPETPNRGTYPVEIPTVPSTHPPAELNPTTSTSDVMRVIADQLRLIPVPGNSSEQRASLVSTPSISIVSSIPPPRIPLSFLGKEKLQVQSSAVDVVDMDFRSCVSEQEPADHMLTLRY